MRHDSSPESPRKPRVPLFVWVVGAVLLGTVGAGWVVIGPAVMEVRAVRVLKTLPGVTLPSLMHYSAFGGRPGRLDTLLGATESPRFVLLDERFPLDQLGWLTSLRYLHSLQIRTPTLRHHDVAKLCSLRHLQSLQLAGVSGQLLDWTLCAGTRVEGDVGGATWSRLESLTMLELRDVPITDVDLKALAQARVLRELTLVNTQVTVQGLQEFARLRSLNRLAFSSPDLTDEDVSLLPANLYLQELSLSDCERVTDAGLVRLTGDPQRISVTSTGVCFGDGATKWLKSRKCLTEIVVDPPLISVGLKERATSLGTRAKFVTMYERFF